jgi:L-asparagine transporter-like permease
LANSYLLIFLINFRRLSAAERTEKRVVEKVLTYITIVFIIIIVIVSLVNINTAIKIGVDAIAVAIIIGMLVYVGRLFSGR